MIYAFDDFAVNAERNELRSRGTCVQIAPKPFAILVYLIENRERMVSKLDLLETFWSPSVSDNVLQSAIRQIRKALGDDGQSQRFIRTHHGHGFTFAAKVRMDEADLPQPHEDVVEKPDVACFDEQRRGTLLACRLQNRTVDAPRARLRQTDTAIDNMFDEAARCVAAHHGVLLHTMPDGFTAVFGTLRSVEGCTNRAIDCAAELSNSPAARALDRCGQDLRFGIDTGRFPLIEGAVSGPVRGLPHGAIHAALTLAEGACAGQAVVSDRAASHLSEDLRRHVSDTRQLSFQDLPDRAARSTVRRPGEFADFIGRRSELALLMDRLARAARGRGQAFLLCGEAGLGKSRLLAEFLAIGAQNGVDRILVAADPRAQNTPAHVIGMLCRKLAEARLLDPAHGGFDDPVDLSIWRALNSREDASEATQPLSQRERRNRIVRMLHALCAAHEPDRSLVIAIEDIHWLDETSRDALKALTHAIADLPVLVIATARPGTAAAGWTTPGATQLWLHPLDPEDSLALIRSRFEPDAIGAEVALGLVSRAAGNPFYLEELCLAVASDRKASSALPDTVREVIAARIDALPVASRTAVLAASAVGPEVPIALLQAVLDWSSNELDTALDPLLSEGLLVEDILAEAAGVRFRHELLRDAAHDMLALEPRAALHRRIATLLQAGPEVPLPERLARHLEEAGDTAAAVDQWTEAARRASRSAAFQETIAFAENGLAQIAALQGGDASGKELRLQMTLAATRSAAHGYGARDVARSYRRARMLAKATGAVETEFSAVVGLWNHAWVLGDLPRARAFSRDLFTIAEQQGDRALRLRANACKGGILFHAGDFDAALAHLETACDLFMDSGATRSRTQKTVVAARCYAAWAASWLGREKTAAHHMKTAEALAAELGHSLTTALFLSLKAEWRLFERDAHGCLGAAAEAGVLSRRDGIPFWHGTALVLRGWATARIDEPAAGLETIRHGLGVFERTGARIQLAQWYGLLAEAHLADGDTDAARLAAQTGADWAHKTGDVYFLPRIQHVLSQVRDA